MNLKKSVYIIVAVFILISIAMVPITGHSLDKDNFLSHGNNDKATKINEIRTDENVVVAKAATAPNNTNISSNNNSVVTNNSKKLAKPSKISQKVISASSYINKYVTKNKKLPQYVTIDGYKFTIPEYMYIMSKTISLKHNKKNSDIVPKYNIKNPSSPNGNSIKGTFSEKQYYTYSKNVVKFLSNKNIAPNYVNTKLGKMQYQTAVYGLNKALYSMKSEKDDLPDNIKVNVPRTHKLNKVIPKYTNIEGLDYPVSIIDLEGENFTIAIAKTIYGPLDVKFNSKYLISTARCSCGKTGDYLYHSSSFINYCPYCKAYGTMSFYDDPRISPEGMWYCLKCDSDYCLVTGKEHITINPKYLTTVIFK